LAAWAVTYPAEPRNAACPNDKRPRVADQEVEGAREQREAQRLHEEERIDDERRQHEEGDHQREGHVLMRSAPDAAGSALASA
jgi:hypothetical protein